MWGLAGWTGSDDANRSTPCKRAVDLGCNFFDTAWLTAKARSELILAKSSPRQRRQETLCRHEDSAQES